MHFGSKPNESNSRSRWESRGSDVKAIVGRNFDPFFSEVNRNDDMTVRGWVIIVLEDTEATEGVTRRSPSSSAILGNSGRLLRFCDPVPAVTALEMGEMATSRCFVSSTAAVTASAEEPSETPLAPM